MKNVDKITQTLSKANGFALIDVLVSIGVLLLILGSSISFMNHMNKSRANSQANVEESSDLNQVLTYLSNPQYVGKLIQYKENETLKSCLIADGKACAADKKHALVVYDLFNNKILNISDRSRHKGMVFSFRGTCEDFATTCDIFSYINIDITFQKKQEDGSTRETHKTVSVKPITQNIISLYPQSSVSKGKPINIIFLIDTSNSMGYVKNSVINGLKNLLDNLKDNETYIELGPMFNFSLTSTKTETYVLDASNNKIPKTPAEINDLNHLDTYYRGYKRVPTKGNYHGYISKSFSPSMTSAQRLSTYNDLINHVDKIFTAGSSYSGQLADIPLCLLLTQIQMLRSGSSSLNTNPQTPTLIYVATNEDDESKLHQIGEVDTNVTAWNLSLKGVPYCGLEFREKLTHYKSISPTWGVYQADSLSVSMKVRAYYQSDDLETSTEKTLLFIPGIPYKKLTTPSEACPTDIASAYKAEIDNSLSQQVFKHIKFEILSCELINQTSRSLLYETNYKPEEDKCKSGFFSNNAGKYTGYDVSTCLYKMLIEGGKASYGYTESGDITTNSFTGTDIIEAVTNEFAATFPTGNYFASFAILPSSGICPIDAGSSVGVRFEQLAENLGKKATIVPVCQGQFSNSFIENAVNHLESKVGNDVFLDTMILKKITQIEIIQDGKKIVLEKTKDYSINGTSVIFTDGLLTAQTQIFIYHDL